MMFARRPLPSIKGANVEMRRFHRRAVAIRAKLRQSKLPQFDVDVVDLSTQGFRTETGVILSPGNRVWLTLPTLAPQEAVVTWRDRYRYGCQFMTPLHNAVLDLIVKRSWAATDPSPAWLANAPGGQRRSLAS